MDVIEKPDDLDPSSLIVFLTGDGRTEYNVIQRLPKKYGGDNKSLLVAKSPYSYKSGTGLNALNAVKTNLSVYKVTNTLCVVDKDFLSDLTKQSMKRKITRKLNDCGVRVRSIKSIEVSHEIVFVVNAEITGRGNILVYLAVIGENKCIEEDIARLIRLELNEEVEPEKPQIRAVLRKNHLNLQSLIDRARHINLAQSFPALDKIMRMIEEE